MSKIEEMAKEYAAHRMQFLKTVGEEDDTSLEEYFEDAVKYGAKAVLEEIENAMDLGEPPYLISTNQVYYQLYKKIQELKG